RPDKPPAASGTPRHPRPVETTGWATPRTKDPRLDNAPKTAETTRHATKEAGATRHATRRREQRDTPRRRREQRDTPRRRREQRDTPRRRRERSDTPQRPRPMNTAGDHEKEPGGVRAKRKPDGE